MKKEIESIKIEDIIYKYNITDNYFETGYSEDFQLLIIWSNARNKEKEILDDLSLDFTILNVYDVEWSEKYINDNFLRLYDVAPNNSFAGKRTEVGDKNFILVILKDKKPMYNYRTDASGRLKIVNTNIVDKKNLYRQWVGGNYMVHSTDNLNEFFNNSVLFFGKNKTFDLISKNTEYEEIETINNDLVGSKGWNTWKELFEVLNLTTQYVVLRGAENIERNVSGLTGDIDILCSNIGEFTAVANAKGIDKTKNFFHVTIEGKDILFDIRYVGDNYFDKSWQEKIISNRILNTDNVYEARVDDYFFSHLYHAYVHKPYFYTKYIDRLDLLAKKVGINDFKLNIEDDKYGLKLLNGYLSAKNYDVTIPNDLQVFLNINTVSSLKNVNKISLYLRLYFAKLMALPSKTINNLKLLGKKNKFVFNILSSIRNKYWEIKK